MILMVRNRAESGHGLPRARLDYRPNGQARRLFPLDSLTFWLPWASNRWRSIAGTLKTGNAKLLAHFLSRGCWYREITMAIENEDRNVLGHIDKLVKEEESLYAKNELTGDDRQRLDKVKIELDQCWDLLRQRRALREFGDDPDKAKVRPAKIVENYEQ
jgi:hypothetical protein